MSDDEIAHKMASSINRANAAQYLFWQPIDTAPVNESVLAFIPNAEHYGPGIYRAMLVDMGSGKRWMTCGHHHGSDCGLRSQPTHWMPLPEPPKE